MRRRSTMCIRPRHYSPRPRTHLNLKSNSCTCCFTKLMGESCESVDLFSWTTVTLAGGGVTLVKTHPHYAPEYRHQIVELTRTDRTPGVMARLDRLGQRLIRRDGQKLLHRHRKCQHRDDRRRGCLASKWCRPLLNSCRTFRMVDSEDLRLIVEDSGDIHCSPAGHRMSWAGALSADATLYDTPASRVAN